MAKFNNNTVIPLAGMIIGNGATHWDVDISPSYPEVVFNFNIIPKDLLDIMKNGDCHYTFRDVKIYNNSKLCDTTWNKIN